MALGKTEYMDEIFPLSDDTPVNREELRGRLRKMTDNELRQFGRAARKMCSPEANRGKSPPPEEIVTQLHEAWAEWKRRFTRSPKHRGESTTLSLTRT
jgi:hypothetical protein